MFIGWYLVGVFLCGFAWLLGAIQEVVPFRQWPLWTIGWPLGLLVVVLYTIKLAFTTAVGIFKKGAVK